MPIVKTTRFGEIEIDDNRIIRFEEGLIGFPNQRDYIIMEHKPGSPFFWLQSISEPSLAFVIIDPFLVKKGFMEDLPPDEKEFFENGEDGEVAIFSIVTIEPGKVDQMTVNLLGPLVIDAKKRTGRQVILVNSGYNRREPLAHT